MIVEDDAVGAVLERSPSSHGSIEMDSPHVHGGDDSVKDFYVDASVLSLGEVLQHNAFADVRIGNYLGDAVAVKVARRDQGANLEAYLLRELAVLKYLSHPNLLNYLGAYEAIPPASSGEDGTPAARSGRARSSNPTTLHIVMQYARGGDLLRLILSDHDIPFPLQARIAYETASALVYLHDRGLVHRDMKSSNVLLTADFHVRVTDFGMARTPQVKRGRELIDADCEYAAPELLLEENFETPTDVHAFGMIVCELLCRRKIGRDGLLVRSAASHYAADEAKVRAALSSASLASLAELCCQCTAFDPLERVTASDAADWLEDVCKDHPPLEGAALPPLPHQPPLPPPRPRRGSSPGGGARGADGGGVAHSGWLYKRNTVGFKNWKKRWFVLRGAHLYWYLQPGAGEPRGHISLEGCRLQRVRDAWRFRIAPLLPSEDTNKFSCANLYSREVGAADGDDFMLWCAKVEAAMASGAPAQRPRRSKRESAGEAVIRMALSDRRQCIFADSGDWLSAIGLRRYMAAFAGAAGDGGGALADISALRRTGLSHEALERLGVVNALHRRYLRRALSAAGTFTSRLQVRVNGFRAFGHVTCWEVESRWRCSVAKCQLEGGELLRLHRKMQRSMRHTPLLSSLPAPPGLRERTARLMQNKNLTPEETLRVRELMKQESRRPQAWPPAPARAEPPIAPGMLRRISSELEETLHLWPRDPNGTEHEDPAVMEARRDEVEIYLQALADLVGSTAPHFQLLLQELGIVAKHRAKRNSQPAAAAPSPL